MTETKRCASCNKSRHYKCYKGNCACKCQQYKDTKKNIEPTPHTYSEKSQESFEEIMNNWKNRHV